jgi:hypothetical protein
MKIVLCHSVLFYAAVTEFVFGVVDRGMMDSKPSLGGICYNNLLLSVDRCKKASLKRLIGRLTKMWHCWTVEAASQICQYPFLLKTHGVALC